MLKSVIEFVCKSINGHRCLWVFVLIVLNYNEIKKILTSIDFGSCPKDYSELVLDATNETPPSYTEKTVTSTETKTTSTSSETVKKHCSDTDIQYQGKLNISFGHLPLSFENIAKREKPDETGLFQPSTCIPPKNSRVAIIIPFRDETKALIRTRHLQYLLEHMIPGIKIQLSIIQKNKFSSASSFTSDSTLLIRFLDHHSTALNSSMLDMLKQSKKTQRWTASFFMMST